MSQLRRIFSDTIVYGLSAALSSLLGFLVVPIYTRVFSPSEYGALAQINTTTSLASVLVLFGLDNSAAVWFWDKPDDEERSRTFSTWLTFMLGAAALVAAAGVALRHLLATVVLKDGQLAHLWVLFAINIVAANAARLGSMWFRLQRSARIAVLLTAGPALATAGCGVLFVTKLRWGLTGVLAGQVVGSWLGLVLCVLALRGVLRPRSVDLERLPPMLKFSAPLVAMAQLSWLMGSAMSYFVNFFCSRSDAGLYQLAASLTTILSLVFFAFDQAWTPFALSVRDEDQARRLYGMAVEASAAIGLLIAFAIAVLARPVLLLVSGPRYTPAEWVLSILAFNAVLANLPAIYSITFAVKKKTLPLARATMWGAAVTVVALPILTPRIGKEGAALAALAGTATLVAKGFRHSQQLFAVVVDWARLARLALCCGLGGAVYASTRQLTPSTASMVFVRSAIILVVTAAGALVYREVLRDGWRQFRSSRT